MYVKCQKYGHESSPINPRILESTNVQRLIKSGQPLLLESKKFETQTVEDKYTRSADADINNLLHYMH